MSAADSWQKQFNQSLAGTLNIAPMPKGSARRLGLSAVRGALPLVLWGLLMVALGWLAFRSLINLFVSVVQGSDGAILAAVLVLLASFGALLLSRPFWRKLPDANLLLVDKSEEPALYALDSAVQSSLGAEPDAPQIYLSAEVMLDVDYPSIRDFKRGARRVVLGMPFLYCLRAEDIAAMLARQTLLFREPRAGRVYLGLRLLLARLHAAGQGDEEDSANGRLNKSNPWGWIDQRLSGIAMRCYEILEQSTRDAVADMEFYADTVAVEALGSSAFDQLLSQCVRVDIAYHDVLSECQKRNRAPMDFFAAVASAFPRIRSHGDQHVEMSLANVFNGAYLHPPAAQRAARRPEADKGCWVLQRSSRSLLIKADQHALTLTERLYRTLGIDTERENNMASSGGHGAIVLRESEEVLRSYASGVFCRELVWRLPPLEKWQRLSADQIRGFMKKVSVSIRKALPRFTDYHEKREEIQKHRLALHHYQWLVKDGSRQRPDRDAMLRLKDQVELFMREHPSSTGDYCKAYGARTSAAMVMGKNAAAYASAVKLAKTLERLAKIQDEVADAAIKSATLEKLIDHRAHGASEHQQTISRMTRMVLRVVDAMEKALDGLPLAWLEGAMVDGPERHRLRMDALNGEDFEARVVERFFELQRLFHAFNTAISAKLVPFVLAVEQRCGIEPVTTVKLARDAAK